MGNDEELEEERRLCFVGMTRAMKELYLSWVRYRSFRGKDNYCIASQFLTQLPRDGVERIDVSRALNYAGTAADEYRAKIGPAAADWADTGARPYIPPVKPRTEIKPTIPDSVGGTLEVGVLVQHEQYGLGKVEEVSGYGAFRKVRVRFPGHGEKVFAGESIKLKVVGRKKAEG
jgi:DNA helicase-2/ATP-dependent DNA helicase PcrA